MIFHRFNENQQKVLYSRRRYLQEKISNTEGIRFPVQDRCSSDDHRVSFLSGEHAPTENFLSTFVRFTGRARETYGSPRMMRDLHAMGIRCSEGPCGQAHVAPCYRSEEGGERVKVTTRTSEGAAVRSRSSPAQLCRKSEWTHRTLPPLWMCEGWLYLALVLDLFSQVDCGVDDQCTH